MPDPVSGLIVYRGRGGNAGRGEPRRPRPLIGSGAAALPLPVEFEWLDDEIAKATSIERRTLSSVG